MTAKPFPRDRALHAGYGHGQQVSARRQRRALRADLRQLSFADRLAPQPVAEPERVDVLKLIIDTAALARIVRRNDRLAEIDADAAKYSPAAPLAAGELVVAAAPGGWASRPSWRVVACACDLCGLGRHVAVDQPFDGGWRHIARAALRRRGEASGKEAERWADVVTQMGPAMGKIESGSDSGAGVLTAWLAEMAAAATGQAP